MGTIKQLQIKLFADGIRKKYSAIFNDISNKQIFDFFEIFKKEKICKNCKYYEFADLDFGFCNYMEKRVYRSYEKEKSHSKNSGISICLDIYAEHISNNIEINGIPYNLSPYFDNTTPLDEKYKHIIHFYVNEKFGCNQFKK